MKMLHYTLVLALALIGLNACSDSDRSTDGNGVLHVKQHLFNYECPSATSCKQTANLYVIQQQGQYMEAEQDFVEQCLADREAGTEVDMACKNMMEPGQTRTMNAPARVIESLLNK